MRKHYLFFLKISFILIVTLLFVACKKVEEATEEVPAPMEESVEQVTEKIDFTSIDQEEFALLGKKPILDSLAIPNAMEQPNDKEISILAKGELWKTWEKLHTECIQNEFFKNPIYLGISNNVDLGSVFSKSGETLEWDISKLLTAEQRLQIINSTKQSRSCSYIKQPKFDFETFMATELSTLGIDAQLSHVIRRSKNIAVRIDKWQIDRLILAELRYLLDTTKDAKLLRFKNDLETKKLILVNDVARIDGFSTLIDLETEMSSELKAGLKKGVIKNIGNTEAKLRFSYETSKQIKVTSEGSFIVFAEMVRADKHFLR